MNFDYSSINLFFCYDNYERQFEILSSTFELPKFEILLFKNKWRHSSFKSGLAD